jgi:hypothetical protein
MHYTVEKVLEERRESTSLLGGSEKLLLVVRGEAVIGLDLSKVTEDDIRVEADHISLRLPHAEVFHVYVDVDETFVYDYRRDVWLQGNELELVANAHKRALDEIRASAQSREILDLAEMCGRSFIQLALVQFGFSNVSITFASPEVEGTPSRLNPPNLKDTPISPATSLPRPTAALTTMPILAPEAVVTETGVPVLKSTLTLTATTILTSTP